MTTRYGKSYAAVIQAHKTGSVILTYSQAEARRLYRMAHEMGLKIKVSVLNPYINGMGGGVIVKDEYEHDR